MNIIKLDAIGSTNTYLKELSAVSKLPNLTVVVANTQYAGRGQRGTKWEGEKDSSLTFSVLVKDVLCDISQIYDLNILTTLSVLQGISKLSKIKLSIKWPNDIMADNKKICGILIENSIKSSDQVQSIIGIGINVNQTSMRELPNASSLFLLESKYFDKEVILQCVLDQLENNLAILKQGNIGLLWQQYHENLFKINQCCDFELPDQSCFKGVIKGVSSTGQLQVLNQDEQIKEFSLKEVKLLY